MWGPDVRRPVQAQGIGYATAKQLASQKANVHMVCRSKERGEAALAKLRAEVVTQSGGAVDGSGVRLHVCDISSMAAVKALSEAYVRGGDPLHVLVNNAGCMVHERTSTPEGVEANFATNTLGTWALTQGGSRSLFTPTVLDPSKPPPPPPSMKLARLQSLSPPIELYLHGGPYV